MEANPDFPNGVVDDIAFVYVLAFLVVMFGAAAALAVRFLRWLWRGTRWAEVPPPPLPRPLLLLDQVPEYSVLAFVWLFLLPFKAPFWAVRWLRRRMRKGRRVLERFDWPKIYRDGERYTVIADYGPPANEGRARLNALAGAGVIAAMRLATRPDWRLPEVGAGVILWPAFFAAIAVYVLSHFPRRTLRLTIGPEGISWRNGGLRPCRVGPEDMAGAVAEVLERHSRAADEQDTDALRRKPSYPVYRIASEVVMHSGFGLRDTQRIAEIRKDRNGQKAKQLQTGVRAALMEFEGAAGRQEAEAEARRPLD
jgi:hypothetical protein